jgi:hypothetical protein
MVIANNALLKGARGRLGGVVFQPWGDKVIVRSAPTRRKVPASKQSGLQQLTRFNFKNATIYAKEVTRDPEKKAYYARKAKVIGVRSAYSAAISDFMRGLTIESVDTRGFKGKVGGQIKVTVRKKDFAAKEVTVSLKTIAGKMIEQGKAAMHSNGAWIYRNCAGTMEPVVVVEVEALNWNGGCERKTSSLVLGNGARRCTAGRPDNATLPTSLQ